MQSEPVSVPVYQIVDTLPGLRHEIHVGVRVRLKRVKTGDC